MRQDLLQDYLVPICSAEHKGKVALLRRLLGTAFFINEQGLFLTAKHVMQAIDLHPRQNCLYGINVKSAGEPHANMFVAIQRWEGAPQPFDVAIGQVFFQSRSWFEIRDEKLEAGWKDVAAMGYPETALNVTPEHFNIHLRMLKGYIQRFVRAGELQIRSPHPDCYELSFQITAGMSGAPLFTTENNKQQLIGVCVGSVSAELVDYASSHVEDDGRELNEKRVKVEQIGLAESIFPLLSWRPEMLGGHSLGEAIRPGAGRV